MTYHYHCQNFKNCLESQCDGSCPLYAQFSYLLERNDLLSNGRCELMSESQIDKYLKIIETVEKYETDYEKDPIGSIITNKSTIDVANQLTYCAVWTNWKGSQLHCTAYNLNFSKYIEITKQSWSRDNDNNQAEYVKIWAESAKILVISRIDFVNFKEFQSQLFLSLIQTRLQKRLTTIIVSPNTSTLIGEGPFFARVCDIIRRNKVG